MWEGASPAWQLLTTFPTAATKGWSDVAHLLHGGPTTSGKVGTGLNLWSRSLKKCFPLCFNILPPHYNVNIDAIGAKEFCAVLDQS